MTMDGGRQTTDGSLSSIVRRLRSTSGHGLRLDGDADDRRLAAEAVAQDVVFVT
jgi:hypothetical protein